MVIDSRDKRAGAISAGIPWIVITPIADGSIGSADRQMVVNVYPGIAAGAPVTTGDIIFGMVRVIRTIKTILEPYGSMYEV